MASRFFESCSPVKLSGSAGETFSARTAVLWFVFLSISAATASAQILLRPPRPGDRITPMPSDMAILESSEKRTDIPCTVTEQDPEVGFDLHFHAGYEVTIPMQQLAGSGDLLTVVFRVYPQNDRAHTSYFVQHFHVPEIEDTAKGEAVLQGGIDLGEGSYHVDWLMRDRAERICSSNWDITAALSPKDKPITLFIAPNEITETSQPFANDSGARPIQRAGDSLNVKLLVNFAPQNSLSAALRRSDTDALVSILKAIERDPRIGHISLVAFNIGEERIVYRQDTAEAIDFPALGKALESMKLGTVNVAHLGDKHSDTDFLEGLIQKEVGTTTHPDAVIFAGPKAMLDANVPQDDLRRIGDIECPVFYMNYNLNPQAVPWKDSISHAIRAFKGTEYTISRPRDLWVSTSEMVSRIVRSKREKAPATAFVAPSQ
jgi:hypothetical protein